jgi:hypothetical protein
MDKSILRRAASAREIHKVYGVSRKKVREALKRGDLVPVQCGVKRVVLFAHVERWLEQMNGIAA